MSLKQEAFNKLDDIFENVDKNFILLCITNWFNSDELNDFANYVEREFIGE